MPILRLLAQIFTFIASTVFPIILAIVLSKMYHTPFRYALFGTLGFIATQILVRIPLLSTFTVSSNLTLMPPVLHAFVLAFTAGLFETVGRLLVFKLFFKKEHGFTAGILAGVGHGGIEAMWLLGLNYINFIIMSAMMLFYHTPEELALALNLPQSAVESISSYTSAAPSAFLYAGFERLFTIAFHIFASILLFYFIQKQKTIFGFIIVLALHTCVDFSMLIMQYFQLSTFTIELVLFAIALASGCGIFLSSKRFNKLVPIVEATKEEKNG